MAVLGNRTVPLLGALLPSCHTRFLHENRFLSQSTANVFREKAEQILYAALRGLKRRSLGLVAAAFFLFLSWVKLIWSELLSDICCYQWVAERSFLKDEAPALPLLPEAERNTLLAFASSWDFLATCGIPFSPCLSFSDPVGLLITKTPCPSKEV